MNEKNYKYHAGTLKYTTASLFMLFFWLLIGGFFFNMMDRLFPVLMPLQLKGFEASNQAIGLIVGSIPSILNTVLNPPISFRSDRTRSKWGRRVPYMLAATPFVTVTLILIGWSAQIGDFVAALCNNAIGGKAAGFVAITIFAVIYQIFYMVVGSVFWYFFADVVPEKFMSRFMACFNLTGQLSYFLFQKYALKYAEGNMEMIYTVLALLYGIFFTLMCLMVKEGEYPPVDENEEKINILRDIKTYCVECFSRPFYLFFFLGTALNAVSMVCGNLFNIFFAKENIGLTVEQFGDINGNIAFVLIFFCLPMGYLADKLHPLRVYLASIVMVVTANIYGYFCAVDELSYIIVTSIVQFCYMMQGAACIPTFVAILPKSRYGQFCSAQAIFNSVLLIVANWGGGLFIDLTGNYRNLYLWDAFFTTLALLAMIAVWIGWKKFGGIKNYIAP